MSYFAIHVKTGWEQFTVDQIQKQIDNTLFNTIRAIIAPVLEVKKFIGQDVVLSKRKMLSSSYIYIKTEENAFEIPAKVYHFLRNIGGVLRVLPYNVPEEEIEAFCNNYDIAINEAEIEIQLDQEAKTIETIETEKAQLLHECNTAPIDEQKEKSQKLNHLNRTIDQFNELIKKGKEEGHRLLSKCQAYIQAKKETFRFPLALFLQTRERIDPHHELTNKQLTTHSFILPELMQTMKEELSRWRK